MNTCPFDPTAPEYKDAPIGMFHCPICGEMVLAGFAHPDYSLLYNDIIDLPEPPNKDNLQS
jgi:hypothetical protein